MDGSGVGGPISGTLALAACSDNKTAGTTTPANGDATSAGAAGNTAAQQAVAPQEPELGVEPGVEIGAAPPELPDVDEGSGRVEDGAHLRQGKASINHAGQAVPARLAGPVGQA